MYLIKNLNKSKEARKLIRDMDKRFDTWNDMRNRKAPNKQINPLLHKIQEIEQGKLQMMFYYIIIVYRKPKRFSHFVSSHITHIPFHKF